VLTGFFNGRRSWLQCPLGTTNAVHGAVSTQQPILLDGGTITRVKFRREPPPLSGMPIEFLDDVSNERCLAIVAEDTHPRHLFVRGADGIAACIKRRQVTLVFPRKCTIEDLRSMAQSTSPQIEHFELVRARNAWQWLYERHGNGAAICYDDILQAMRATGGAETSDWLAPMHEIAQHYVAHTMLHAHVELFKPKRGGFVLVDAQVATTVAPL
jgi:hypothetical protein